MFAFGGKADVHRSEWRWPSVPQEAVDDLSVNLARAHAACTIVVLLRNTRIRVVQQGTGEIGRFSTIRCCVCFPSPFGTRWSAPQDDRSGHRDIRRRGKNEADGCRQQPGNEQDEEADGQSDVATPAYV